MKKIIILVVMVAAFVLPTMAQSAQEWQTASLPGSGSNYAPQVTAVGSSVAASEATTTTETYTPGAPGAIRRGYDANGNWVPDGDDFGGGAESGASNQFPLGDAVLPLLALAMVYGIWCMVYRRKRPA